MTSPLAQPSDPTPAQIEALIDGLRRDAGDYRFHVLGLTEPDRIYGWDRANVRAWEAAEALHAKDSEIAALNERIAAALRVLPPPGNLYSIEQFHHILTSSQPTAEKAGA